ncbi:MAG: hypothetical protein JST16_14725 [Bdellovibrionales bacterium]|nr:hypothetical protein [Bdellovibrionales bacterium]
MSHQTYFARYGKIFGPFSEQEVTLMHGQGKIRDFSWIWDAPRGQWKPVDPPPPMGVQVRHESPQLPTPVMGQASEAWDIEAICHNSQEYLSGKLAMVTETGCEFSSPYPAPYPAFGDGSPVLLNLFDNGSGMVQNVRARVCAISRDAGTWVYRLRWEQRPVFA